MSSDSDSSNRKRKGKRRHAHRSKRRRLDKMEDQLSKLTELVTKLVPQDSGKFKNDSSDSDKDSISSDESVRLDRSTKRSSNSDHGHSATSVSIATEQSHLDKSKMSKETSHSVGSEGHDDDILEVTVLHEDIQKLLGDTVPPKDEKGPPVHPELAKRWESVAKSGLAKEERDRIRKAFKPPSNCNVTGPPLNPELTKAVNNFTKLRDDELTRIQGNISTVITGLGMTLTGLLDDSSIIDKTELISKLSDTARFLCGTQYQISLLRRREVKTNIKDGNMGDILQGTPIYPELFGADLAARVKQATTLSKVGQEMVKGKDGPSAAKPRFSKESKPTKPAFTKTENSLNFKGPLRQRKSMYQNRSGRRDRK